MNLFQNSSIMIIIFVSLTLFSFTSFAAASDFVSPFFDARDDFVKIVQENAPGGVPTDKITHHSYELIYGGFLLPLVEKAKRTNSKLKVMEIGLGCDSGYGPGKSVAVWKALYGKHADIWEAEFVAECVTKTKAEGKMEGISVVTGDQGNKTVVERWVQETGGNFNVIIDDGGHHNKQIKTTFDVLWDQALLPGETCIFLSLCFLFVVCISHHWLLIML